jgi:hypothetical protein
MFKVSRTLLSQRGLGSGNSFMQPQEYSGLAVTASDGTDLPGGATIGLLATGSGNINVNLEGGGTAVLTGLSAGQIVDIAVTRVLATSTTATGIVALYR